MPNPTQDISNIFRIDYSNRVKQAYQRMGSLLMHTVTKENDVQGSSFRFRRSGLLEATTKNANGVFTASTLGFDERPCLLEETGVFSYSNKFTPKPSGIDEQNKIAKEQASGLGRKTDSYIINAVSESAIVDANNIGAKDADAGTNGKLTLDRVFEATELLEESDVNCMKWAIVSPKAWSDLERIDQFSDADYVGNDKLPFVYRGFGFVKKWHGFMWTQHTGLNKFGASGSDAGSTECLFYATDAVGLATGYGMETHFDWENDRNATSIMTAMYQGATDIDPKGIVRVYTSNANNR